VTLHSWPKSGHEPATDVLRFENVYAMTAVFGGNYRMNRRTSSTLALADVRAFDREASEPVRLALRVSDGEIAIYQKRVSLPCLRARV
jgi:hypothetical protein